MLGDRASYLSCTVRTAKYGDENIDQDAVTIPLRAEATSARSTVPKGSSKIDSAMRQMSLSSNCASQKPRQSSLGSLQLEQDFGFRLACLVEIVLGVPHAGHLISVKGLDVLAIFVSF